MRESRAAGALPATASAGIEAVTKEGTQASARGIIRAAFVVVVYLGYTSTIAGVASPWIAKSFALNQTAISRLYAWLSIASVGTLLLTSVADRVGRRPVVLGCLGATAFSALMAAAAPSALLFIIWATLASACVAAAFSVAIVVLAEELPTRERAKGQGYAGFANRSGFALCVLLMPLFARNRYSWRLLMVLSAVAGASLWPWIAAEMPRRARRKRKKRAHGHSQDRLRDLVGARYRRRFSTLMGCAFLSSMAGTAANSWTYYHAITVVGLSPARTSTVMLAGDGLGMLGFMAGAWAAELFGRVPVVVGFGTAMWLGAIAFYWGPPAHFLLPALWLGTAYSWFVIGGNAMTVGANAAATELFPTALRGTIVGAAALFGAVGSAAAQLTISALDRRLGGLSNVTGYLALLGIVSALIFGTFIDETRGLSLKDAALEEDLPDEEEPHRHVHARRDRKTAD